LRTQARYIYDQALASVGDQMEGKYVGRTLFQKVFTSLIGHGITIPCKAVLAAEMGYHDESVELFYKVRSQFGDLLIIEHTEMLIDTLLSADHVEQIYRIASICKVATSSM
jgi:hypothetical protein